MTDGSVCRKMCGRQREFGQNIFQTSRKKQNNCFISSKIYYRINSINCLLTNTAHH